MKTSMLVTVTAVIAVSLNVQAATPFTWSGESISAIFKSTKVWTKLGSSVETIVFKGYANKTSTYALTTTESIGIVDQSGVTTGYKKVPCMILVDVTATGDLMAPTLEVSNVDFTACPQTAGK